MLTLDVRSQDSVQVCVRTVLDSEGRIDLTGEQRRHHAPGLAEETDVAEARAQKFSTTSKAKVETPLRTRPSNFIHTRAGCIQNPSTTARGITSVRTR